jgi:4-hydroxybenzoate polyprenyltransferase
VLDIRGDKTIGARTLPIIAGPIKACNISALILSLLCFMLPLPYILGILNAAYIVIVLAIVYPMLFYIIIRLFRKPQAGALPIISNLIKASMVTGLIAMIVS